MKFVSLNRKNKEALHIKAPHRGMDLTKPTVHLNEDTIGISKNMIFDDGVLKTRNGLNTKLENILDLDIMNDALSYEFFTTKTEIFHNGENKRIAVAKVEYDISHYFLMVYLIGQNTDSEYISHMHFMRTDSETFYIPVNVTFYSGKSQTGGGIFAFVTLSNIHKTSDKEYAVYEISEKWNSWERAYSYYTPTVYINGRGNAYEEAKADDQISSFTPKTLEAPNLIYNRFYAYFTSDGYSSSFRLPFTELANSNVICRVHTSPTEYTEWVVEPNKTNVSNNFKGATVTFNVDRVTGLFYFTSNGTNYSMPVFSNYRQNNIRIAAQKDYTDSFDSVVSCTVCETLGSAILFSGGNDKNKVFYTRYENPLYFPKLEENEIGSADEGTEIFYRYADAIYAFKDNKIYSVRLLKGKAVNSTSILADNGKTFFENYDFKIECINDKIGNVRKDTVADINGKLIWQDKNGKVYLFVGGNTLCISNEIEPLIEEIGTNVQSVATVFDRKYILCYQNKSLVFDFKNGKNLSDLSEIARYYWIFPTEVEISGCMNINNNLILLCRNSENTFCYTASLDAVQDTVLIDSSKKEIRKIPSFVKFKSYFLSDGRVKKCIHTALFQLSLSAKTKIKIGEGVNSEEFILKRNGFSTSGQDSVRIMPDLFGVDLVDISIDSEDAFSFSSAEIYYTKTVF